MTTYTTTREIPAPVEQVFAAISDPERLARWWGPAGFTNTFSVCDFRNGGHWVFTMHGPDGHSYANESVFAQIEPPRKVIIQHISKPGYLLTIALAPKVGGTLLSWSQAFDDARVGQRLESIVVPANEQNLDRLTAEVLRNAGAESN